LHAEAQAVIAAWRLDYHEVRPYSAFGDVTPATVAAHPKPRGLALKEPCQRQGRAGF
jgi:transposase InsO family protein